MTLTLLQQPLCRFRSSVYFHCSWPFNKHVSATMGEKNVNEIQPFIKIGHCGAMIGQTEIMHNSLGPEKLLATCLKDKVDQPISVCLCLPRAQGKTDWAINEKHSQVLWVEGGISLCAQTITRLSTRCFFICGYFYRIL